MGTTLKITTRTGKEFVFIPGNADLRNYIDLEGDLLILDENSFGPIMGAYTHNHAIEAKYVKATIYDIEDSQERKYKALGYSTFYVGKNLYATKYEKPALIIIAPINIESAEISEWDQYEAWYLKTEERPLEAGEPFGQTFSPDAEDMEGPQERAEAAGETIAAAAERLKQEQVTQAKKGKK